LLNRFADRSSSLLNLYLDKDGARQIEIEKISGASEFSEFYNRLKDIKDYHRRYPNEANEPMELEFMSYDQEREDTELLERLFSGEETYGRFLDLHTIHEEYLNVKDVKKLNYLAFLNSFANFSNITRTAKYGEYKKYLRNLRNYLETFFERTQPLFDLLQLQRDTICDFDRLWSQGIYPRWERVGDNLDESSKDLFCVACQKEFAKKTVFDAHLSGKKHIKAVKLMNSNGIDTSSEEVAAKKWEEVKKLKQEREREVALLEALITKYSDVLEPYLEATKENVERKQTLTESELKDDVEAEDLNIEAAESDDEEKIYNPLKLPLGWDGKPIPYWLYKLHGLGIEYSCEICGNFVYMGRKAFERHFQEWRHAHGMRCLGIPNTRHFHEITLIEDAYALWDKLKKMNKEDEFKAEAEEEFEDAQGNVFNKKTYKDLKRQGLL